MLPHISRRIRALEGSQKAKRESFRNSKSGAVGPMRPCRPIRVNASLGHPRTTRLVEQSPSPEEDDSSLLAIA